MQDQFNITYPTPPCERSTHHRGFLGRSNSRGNGSFIGLSAGFTLRLGLNLWLPCVFFLAGDLADELTDSRGETSVDLWVDGFLWGGLDVTFV